MVSKLRCREVGNAAVLCAVRKIGATHVNVTLNCPLQCSQLTMAVMSCGGRDDGFGPHELEMMPRSYASKGSDERHLITFG